MAGFDQIDYTTRDFEAIRQDLINAIPARIPEWTSRSAGDLGIVLLEMWAYVGDILNYYADRIANEAFISTAQRRSSVLQHAALIDYVPTPNTAATVTLTLTTQNGTGAITIPAGTQVLTPNTSGSGSVSFETDTDLVIPGTTGSPSPIYSLPVNATQGVTISNETVGQSAGTARQDFVLFNASVIGGSAHIFVDEGSGPVEWTFITHLTDASATDQVFSIFVDDVNITHVVFGDGVNGRIPGVSALISSSYRVGGGVVGNVGANTLTQLGQGIDGVVSVTNASNAVGGADPESLDSIRINAPKSLRAIQRAVTLDDYASLALQVPGVAKASANATIDTSVLLYIAPPAGHDASLATNVTVLGRALTKTDGTGFLDTKKMIGTVITVLAPTFVGVNIAMELHVKPTFSQSLVAQAMTAAVGNLLNFKNVDFGQRVTLSSVYNLINSVPGLDFIVVTLMARADGTQSGANDAVFATNEIPELGVLTLSNFGGV